MLTVKSNVFVNLRSTAFMRLISLMDTRTFKRRRKTVYVCAAASRLICNKLKRTKQFYGDIDRAIQIVVRLMEPQYL